MITKTPVVGIMADSTQDDQQPESMTTDQRRVKVVELRALGHTYDEIARELGYADRSGAHRAYEALMENAVVEATESARNIELRRLDMILKAVMKKAANGDLAVIDRVLKIMDRRAKLLGLDAPEKHEISRNDEEVLTILSAQTGKPVEQLRDELKEFRARLLNP